MRSKAGFIVGIGFVCLGIVIVVANALNGYMCMCPAQYAGQPNTCFCSASLSYYSLDIVGLIVSIIGLALVLSSIRKPKVPSKSEETQENFAH